MPTQPNNPANKIYVGNLGPKVSGPELQMLFSKFGTVRWADVAVAPGSAESKGFAFVMMGSEQEARKAVIGLNGTRQFGAMLKVSVAQSGKPKGAAPGKIRPRGPRRDGPNRFRGSRRGPGPRTSQ